LLKDGLEHYTQSPIHILMIASVESSDLAGTPEAVFYPAPGHCATIISALDSLYRGLELPNRSSIQQRLSTK